MQSKTEQAFFLLLVSLLVLFFSTNFLYGQIFTPEGCPVSCTSTSYSPPTQAVWETGCTNYRLLKLGGFYGGNCHGYAFSCSETGVAVSIGTNSEAEKFWNDQGYSNDGQASYIEVDSSIATHVAIYGVTGLRHSMRRIKNSYPVAVRSYNGVPFNYVSASINCYLTDPGLTQSTLTGHYYGGPSNTFRFYKLKTDHYGTLYKHPNQTPTYKTWIGAGEITHTVSNDVVVPVGVVLTIQPGATVKFAAGKKMTVYGSLNASGVTFIGNTPSTTWGGIVFSGNGSGSLNNCTISNTQFGNAIEINSGAFATLEYCTISGGNGGIYCAYSGARAKYTIITGCRYALLGYYSTLDLGDPSPHAFIGHNSIKYNTGYGVRVSSSTVFLGYSFNSIHSNYSYEVYAYNSSLVYAVQCYWHREDYPPNYTLDSDYYESSATVYRNPGLQNDPNPPTLLKTGVSKDILTDAVRLENSDKLVKLLLLEKEGKMEDALQQYQSLFNEVESIATKKYILIRTAHCFKAIKRNDFSSFLENIFNLTNEKNSELKAAYLEAEKVFYINNKEYKKALVILNKLLKDYSGIEELHKNTLYDLGFINYSVYNDKNTANIYFDELISKYPESDLTEQVYIMRGNYEKLADMYNNSSKEKPEEVKTASDYVLLSNYPNPFNPETNIEYSIPTDEFVSIKVFDILGREVAELVNEKKQAGIYSVRFDGSNLSSGIYFYTISAGNYRQVNKMVLTK